MNMDKSQISQVMFAAVDEVNQLLPKAQRLEKSLDTVISGEGGRLDSLGLVNLIFAIEQKLEQQCRVTIALVDEAALSRPDDPFRTLGTLTDHVHSLVEKKLHG
jgi:acyl carrier protein